LAGSSQPEEEEEEDPRKKKDLPGLYQIVVGSCWHKI